MNTTDIYDHVPDGYIHIRLSEKDRDLFEDGNWDYSHPCAADCRSSAIFEHSTSGYVMVWVDPDLWHAKSLMFGTLSDDFVWAHDAHRTDDGGLELDDPHDPNLART